MVPASGSASDRERSLDWLAEGLAGAIQLAGGHGYSTSVLLEPLNRYETNAFNRLGDATVFLVSCGLRGAKVLADLFHMNIEEDSIEDAILGAGSFIGHVHLADSNRGPAGMGHTNMATIARSLRQIGYQGYVSAEALAYPDSVRGATQTIVAFRRWFQETPLAANA